VPDLAEIKKIGTFLQNFHFSEFSKGNSEISGAKSANFSKGKWKKGAKKSLKKSEKNRSSRGGEYTRGPLRSSAWPGIFSKMARESGLIRTPFFAI